MRSCTTIEATEMSTLVRLPSRAVAFAWEHADEHVLATPSGSPVAPVSSVMHRSYYWDVGRRIRVGCSAQ